MPAITASTIAKLHRLLLALLLAATTTMAVAQEDPQQGAAPQAQRQGAQGERRGAPPQEQRPGAAEQGVLRLLPADAVTQHSITTPDGKFDYTATAGTLSLFDQSGQRSAAIFYVAYVAKGADTARRPLTFVFNG